MDGPLNFIIGDHLGSSSLTTDVAGNELASMRYKAWGETRHSTGSLNMDDQYTGLRTMTKIGLHFYREASRWDNARWYDSSLSRFAQADTIVPSTQGVQGLDRYGYVLNNPVNFNDPDGHCAVKPGFKCPTNPKITTASIKKKNVGEDLSFNIFGVNSGQAKVLKQMFDLLASTKSGGETARFLSENKTPITLAPPGDNSHTVCTQSSECTIYISQIYLGPIEMTDSGVSYPNPDLGDGTLSAMHEGQHAMPLYNGNSQYEEYMAYLSEETLRVELQNRGVEVGAPRSFSMVTDRNNPTEEELGKFLRSIGRTQDLSLPVFPWR